LAHCSAAELSGYSPHPDEVAAHRQHALSAIHYPFGRWPAGITRSRWPFDSRLFLTLKVDESGRVVCYRMTDKRGNVLPLNKQRQRMLRQFAGVRYSPFTDNGHPVVAVIVEHIVEDESPRRHVVPPRVPLESVSLRLERLPTCLVGCRVYSVEVFGDGHVVYNGLNNVDVQGKHRYKVPSEDVSRLVQMLRSGDLWSLRKKYDAKVYDDDAYRLTMRLGSVEHQIWDSSGNLVGMPAAVTDFENEIDRVAHTDMWLTLTHEGIEHLKKEGFLFQSQQGGELLARVVAEARDEPVLLELVELGVPLRISLGSDELLRDEETLSVLDGALVNGQGALADALISRGALKSSGKLDPVKLDVAFRAAVAGGRLPLIQKIWDAGEGVRPSLTYLDSPDPGRVPGKLTSVILLHPPSEPVREDDSRWERNFRWEGLQIVKWLEAQGCDLKSSTPEGITLLHVAAEAPDIELVRYLLSQGLKDVATRDGETALGNALTEDIHLLLLESGASQPPSGEAGRKYLDQVARWHWDRVVAWLKAHGG
jgi:hypothetical protein